MADLAKLLWFTHKKTSQLKSFAKGELSLNFLPRIYIYNVSSRALIFMITAVSVGAISCNILDHFLSAHLQQACSFCILVRVTDLPSCQKASATFIADLYVITKKLYCSLDTCALHILQEIILTRTIPPAGKKVIEGFPSAKSIAAFHTPDHSSQHSAIDPHCNFFQVLNPHNLFRFPEQLLLGLLTLPTFTATLFE